jgi:proteasome lid subunit RPN8/RPN11
MLAAMDPEPNQPFDAATTVEHSPEETAAPRLLKITSAQLDQIVSHLRASLPNEGCGLLASVSGVGQDRAVHFFPGTNVDRSPVRYTMEPVEVIAAMKRMRDEGWQLAAIVHSHPRTKPEPSRTDQMEWYYAEARLLIVSFAEAQPGFGCWALAGDRQSREFRASQILITGR